MKNESQSSESSPIAARWWNKIPNYAQGLIFALLSKLHNKIARLTEKVNRLQKTITSLRKELHQLRQENAKLKQRLEVNSTNSSKPPSSDGPEGARPSL